ncbi:MAG: prephenate/arogenate dehydrogenase family protein [Maricaulaceae bacterium]
MNQSPSVERLLIVGVGLIGGSIARAARANALAEHIALIDRDPDVVARAAALGLGDQIEGEASDLRGTFDLCVVATPMGAIGPAAAGLGDVLAEGAILTDVGSVKGGAYDALAQVGRADVAIIPGHPIAGTEQSGPEAGFAHLFAERWWVLTPAPDTDAQALTRLSAFITGLGAKVETMDPGHHDLVLAITSHVPHLIAYNIVGTAADLETVTASEVIKYSAGGFRDFTRIAASDPVMWRDIFLTNKEAVLEMLGRFSEDLIALQRAIRWGDGDALHALFTRTRAIRRSVIEAGQDTAEADFGRGHERTR